MALNASDDDWRQLLEEGVQAAREEDAQRDETINGSTHSSSRHAHGDTDTRRRNSVDHRASPVGSHRGDSYRRDDRRDDRRYRSHHSRSRSRERSPRRDRDYGRSRYGDDYRRADYRDRDRDRRRGDSDRGSGYDYDRRRRSDDRGDRRGNGGGRGTAQPPADTGKDEATVFVQQISRQARERHLIKFFESIGEVRSAKVVTDRDGRHSKGVGFVEFADVASVEKAINMTGQKLMGVPIIVQRSEAEKNRVAPTSRNQPTLSNGIPFNRLYIGNVHFNVGEADLEELFNSFGPIEAVQLSVDDSGRSRGHGFVQFENADDAKEALAKMNGQDLLGRPLRVGLGNKELHAETSASMVQRLDQATQASSGSAFSGAGGRTNNASTRDDRNMGSMGALDDSDVSGVNYSNFSREALMKKLARTEDIVPQTKAAPKKAPIASYEPARCVLIKNAYDEAEEEGDWEAELADDFKTECSEQYGNVVFCAIPDNDREEGPVYLKFEDLKGGDNALKGLNGRLFGGRLLTAQPVIDAIFNSLFPKAASL